MVNYIYVGKPLEAEQKIYGTKPRIQLGDKFAELNEIPLYVASFIEKIKENQRPLITTSLRVDGDVTMGIVSDVKTQLRKSGQLKVNYSAKKEIE